MELTRRGFLKSVGAATLAVAAVGLLGGCEGGEMVGNANGLNDTAELKGIKMTVRSLAYEITSAVFFALLSGLEYAASNLIFFKPSAVSSARWIPYSFNGISTAPCTLCSLFQSVSPCRTI